VIRKLLSEKFLVLKLELRRRRRTTTTGGGGGGGGGGGRRNFHPKHPKLRINLC
jgi:hypothetical protein